MKAEIINNLDNPSQLEKLYQNDKVSFKRNFNLIFQDIQENPTAQVWNARLNTWTKENQHKLFTER
ncbi:MAG: hypothetical protein R2798_07080 [Chitinophagales bacterium]